MHDDVDQIDRRSLDVLHYLARWTSTSPLNVGSRLAVIGSLESDALADLPLRALERQGMARVLRIDNLGELEALALVRALAGPTSQLVAESVASAAEGNPLTIRAVTDRLIAEWDLTAPPEATGTPQDEAWLSFPHLIESTARSDGTRTVVTTHPATDSQALLEIPRDVAGLRAREPKLAEEWRLAVRDGLTTAFAAGYRAVGVIQDKTADPKRDFYLLRRA